MALGSNLGDRLSNLREGGEALARLHRGIGRMLCSSVWETEPVDCEPNTSAYLNAVVEIQFSGSPLVLLEALQSIERTMGRPERRPRNAPRTLDLDVLYAGELVCESGAIIIPHPRMHLRRFVLAPLCDIRPGLILPGMHETAKELLERAPAARVKLHSRHF